MLEKRRREKSLLELLPAWKTPPSGLWSSESAVPRAWMDGWCQPCAVTETVLWACQSCQRKHDALVFVIVLCVSDMCKKKADLTPASMTLIVLSASRFMLFESAESALSILRFWILTTCWLREETAESIGVTVLVAVDRLSSLWLAVGVRTCLWTAPSL